MLNNQGTYDNFLLFRAMIIRAVAKAWGDEEYSKLLQENPKQALESAFPPYRYPFTAELTASAGAASYTPGLNLGWVTHKREKLTLVLPPKPAAVAGDEMANALNQAAALAAFNATHLTFLHSTKE